jgi:hypothetical protein
MVLDVVVHPVGRHEQPLEEIGKRRARVAQRIVVVAHDGVLGDVPDPTHELIPGRERQQPQQGIEPPIAGC